MSILYDEGQQAIASESRRILEAHVTTEALLPLLETRDAIFEPFWTIAKEQGWTAVALPEAYGGLGLGERQSVGEGKRVSVRVDLGGSRILKNKNTISEKATHKQKR